MARRYTRCRMRLVSVTAKSGMSGLPAGSQPRWYRGSPLVLETACAFKDFFIFQPLLQEEV